MISMIYNKQFKYYFKFLNCFRTVIRLCQQRRAVPTAKAVWYTHTNCEIDKCVGRAFHSIGGT